MTPAKLPGLCFCTCSLSGPIRAESRVRGEFEDGHLWQDCGVGGEGVGKGPASEGRCGRALERRALPRVLLGTGQTFQRVATGTKAGPSAHGRVRCQHALSSCDLTSLLSNEDGGPCWG